MTSEKIKTIELLRQTLALYYEGETSPQQEAALKEFFLEHNDVDDEFKADRAIFVSLNSEVPTNLEERILDATCGRKRRRHTNYWVRSAAAAVATLIVVSMVFTYQPEKIQQETVEIDNDDPYIEITDPEEAQRIANEAIALINDQLAYTAKSIEQANEILKTAVQ